MQPPSLLDVCIIGAGPAGLTAAIYLGRFHRSVAIIDGGESRARWIPESHNIPGFSRGVGGIEFLSQLREQAGHYGASVQHASVQSIRKEDAAFRIHTNSGSLLARVALLATGVQDDLPKIRGTEPALLRSVLRICPICDAYEATGRRIAVIGAGEHAVREAHFLRHYSDSVTLLYLGSRQDSADWLELETAGIGLIPIQLHELQLQNDGLAIHPAGGQTLSFDVVYSALGCHPRNELANSLGADVDESGALRVNSHQETSVAGLYAAGDLVRGLNQVVVAAAEAAVAATDIHNRLRGSLSDGLYAAFR